MADSLIWTITDDDAKAAEDAAHAEAMAAVEDAWLRQTDLLATAYGAMLTKLPKHLANAILLMYAKRLLLHDANCDGCEDDAGAEWHAPDDDGD